MPARDGRGPMGMGQMTGRGLGFCGNKFYGRRNCYERAFGRRGFGYGPKFGPGYGYGPGYGFRNDKTGKEFLQEQKEFLESQIELIEREIDDLDD